MSVFARLSPRLQEAIVARLGWSSLRPVQEEAGEALLAGNNAVILAPTAGGKTEAAMFPALSQMIDDEPEAVGVIYVAPIKALLNNQAERLGEYTEMVGLSRFVWHGDTPDNKRRAFRKNPSHLLMTTPESLEVMLVSRSVDESRLFRDLRMVVIDEIHAIAGTDRGAHLMSVLERIAALSRHDVQRVGLSATVGNPDRILTWLTGRSARPGLVVDPPKVPSKKQLLITHREDLSDLARDAAQLARGQKSLFFCQSRSVTEAVAQYIRRGGTAVFVHHSSVSKEEREEAEESFHRGSDACIVCTSTLELGIDVGDLDRVLQAEAPDTVGAFMQRMGRTGRREGMIANTTFFCQSSASVLQALALTELAKEGWVENIEVNDRCWPVLIHQLLAMSLADDRLTVEKAWKHLDGLPDFAGIKREEYDRLIEWLLKDQALIVASGRLCLGPKAEKEFGRRNFMELFAVFSSPQSYTVQAGEGQPIGTLQQQYVDRLAEGVSTFLLGGRGWAVMRIQHEDRRIHVQPAPRGQEPKWTSFVPQFLGYELCQKALEITISDRPYRTCDPAAAEILQEMRDEMQPLLSGSRIEDDGDLIRWWTFAGGKINSTLRYALQSLGHEWKITSDNYAVKAEGQSLDKRKFIEAIRAIRNEAYWKDEQLWREVAEDLPNYRLSKFQPVMPDWVQREVISAYLLDTDRTWEWLMGMGDYDHGDPSEPKRKRTPNSGRQEHQRQTSDQQSKSHRDEHGESKSSSSKTPDNFEILGISKTASRQEVRTAYLHRMAEYHPDKVASLGPKLRELAEQESKAINAAYEAIMAEIGQ